jgi:hypothetical protein
VSASSWLRGLAQRGILEVVVAVRGWGLGFVGVWGSAAGVSAEVWLVGFLPVLERL